MNGALPGLLDDPHLSLTDLPTLADFHIAPLRNPAPLKSNNIPSPLEPIAKDAIEKRPSTLHKQDQRGTEHVQRRPSVITPNDVFLARENKKPVIAISELLDGSPDHNVPLQLPSFVSLSVVEKSPIPQPYRLEFSHPQKRVRLDPDFDNATYDVKRFLPRPPQKDEKPTRPVPLLPAMVTGLHEPPPSAALLPSMDLDTEKKSTRVMTNSKIQVKDILEIPKQTSNSRPPELMINTPEVSSAELPKVAESVTNGSIEEVAIPAQFSDIVETSKRDNKARRTRRKWSDEETSDLIAGVQKHGFGKWKQILEDAEFTFTERTSIDLKDRFRVFTKDNANVQRHEKSTLANASRVDGNTDENKPAKFEMLANQTLANSVSETVSKPRRKRHPWTKEEDAALLMGVDKHGFQWTDIHHDTDLHLDHRRATDLRDRIRNLYPEGYKKAEARPLRKELQKAAKTNATDSNNMEEAQEILGTNDDTGLNAELSIGKSVGDTAQPRSSKSHSKKATSIAALTSVDNQPESPQATRSRASMADIAIIEHGVTLPSLDLDEGHQHNWEDNTLAPFLRWDDNLGL